MMPLCWSILLLCLSVNAEIIVKSGGKVTLECSSDRCRSSVQGCAGMYLYKYFKEREEVLFYHKSGKVTPRQRYKDRIQTNGSLGQHTTTISNLTVDDTGLYRCVYKKMEKDEVQCDVYALLVIEAPCALANGESPPLVLIIIVATVTITTLVTALFIVLILPRMKQWISSRRRLPQVSNDNVYEVMTKNGLRPLAAPEPSPPSL